MNKSTGNLLYDLAVKHRTVAGIANNAKTVVEYIRDKKITSKAQLEEAFAFLKQNATNIAGLDAAIGVGSSVSAEDVTREVKKILDLNKEDVQAKRYRINVGFLIGKVRETLKWADVAVVKTEIEKQVSFGNRICEAFPYCVACVRCFLPSVLCDLFSVFFLLFSVRCFLLFGNSNNQKKKNSNKSREFTLMFFFS